MNADSLKVAALVIGATATLISAAAKVVDEKEKLKADVAGLEKPQTRTGRRALYVSLASLAIAVVGFATSLAVELVSQRAAIDAATKQAAANEKTLQGLARIYTRFDTIAVSAGFSLPLSDQSLSTLQVALKELTEELVDISGKAGEANVRGLSVDSSIRNEPRVFRYQYHFPEIAGGYPKGTEFLSQFVPHIAIFKTPLKEPLTPNQLFFPGTHSKPDVLLSPAEGAAYALFIPPDETNTLLDLHYKKIDMPSRQWNLTGNVLSLKDLEGCQAVIFPSITQDFALWRALKITHLAFTINNRWIDVPIQNIQTLGSANSKVYTYIFPKLVDF
jgi:hypothetical protein